MNASAAPRAGMIRWPYPRILAHRGGGTLAPENTLGAIRLGAHMGFAGVEIDVMLAGDGTPVLMHDQTLKRTAGLRASDGVFASARKLPARSRVALYSGR